MVDLINGFGKDCQLVFPGSPMQPCNNCVLDSFTKKSTNVYLTGGPQPFMQGTLCPVCGGKGMRQAPAVTQTIRMIVRWNPSDFKVLPGNIEMPFGEIETEGLMVNLPLVQQSRVMYVDLPVMPVIRARYELSGQPADVHELSPNTTFVVHWKRKG